MSHLVPNTSLQHLKAQMWNSRPVGSVFTFFPLKLLLSKTHLYQLQIFSKKKGSILTLEALNSLTAVGGGVTH